jgi:hypothetical protein
VGIVVFVGIGVFIGGMTVVVSIFGVEVTGTQEFTKAIRITINEIRDRRFIEILV